MIKVQILDCKIEHKMKPIHNLSLILAFISLSILIILRFFNSDILSVIFFFFLVLALISITLFIICSLFFLKKKYLGEIYFEKEKVIINDTTYNLSLFNFDLNTGDKKIKLNKSNIKKLPYWGNYMINTKTNEKIEFFPNPEIEKISHHINIKNSSRPILKQPISDLLNSFMDTLWAMS